MLQVRSLALNRRWVSVPFILYTGLVHIFKEGAKPITLCVSDFDRAAPHGTGHIKAGLNYAMSLHANVMAHANGYDEIFSLIRAHVPTLKRRAVPTSSLSQKKAIL